jgi:O-methyltransferase
MLENLGKALRRGARVLSGAPRRSVMDQLVHRDLARWEVFVRVLEYLNYEGVPGDVLEFGVFAGASLALLGRAHACDDKGMARRLAGFDSFGGLPTAGEEHARWRPGDCAVNRSWHPLLAADAPVTPQTTLDLFRACGLPPPEIEAGGFAETLPRTVPAKYPRVALVHVDCDLYESAQTVLAGVAPALQDGAVLLFDDWFHYKGHPDKGEAHAFQEFLAAHPEWGAAHYRSYATFCNSFILYRR